MFSPLITADESNPIEPVGIVVEAFLPVGNAQQNAEKLELLISSQLSEFGTVTLLERDSLSALVEERSLGKTMSNDDMQVEHGEGLTGARFLLGGSVLEHSTSIYFFGKIINVDDGSMRAFTVSGRNYNPLEEIAEKAVLKAVSLITQATDKTNDGVEKISRMALLAEKLEAHDKPTLSVSIEEEHSNRSNVVDRSRNRRAADQVIDPAAETEFLVFSSESGFPVIDNDPQFKDYVDVLIVGEGFSEVSYRNGSAVGVTARLEVKAVSRTTGRVLAVDRQTSVVVAGSEMIGSKDALAKAAAAIAMRMLPRLVIEHSG